MFNDKQHYVETVLLITDIIMKCRRVMFHFCFLLVRAKTSYKSPWVRKEKDL